MNFGVFKAFAMACFGNQMNATLETFGQHHIPYLNPRGTELTNDSSTSRDPRSTAQSLFEIFQAELPGSSLEPRGKEARPPPDAPGLGGAEPNC